MRHSASVVLPEPEPPSTAAWRFSTFMLSVIGLAAAADLAAGEDARAVAAVLVEDDRQRQLVVVGRQRLGGAAVAPGAVQSATAAVPRPARRRGAGRCRMRRRRLGGRAAASSRLATLRGSVPAEQIEAQQLDDRDQVRQQLGAARTRPRSPGRCDGGRGTRAPSSCAPTRGSAPGSSGRRRRGTCGRPARSGSSCSAGNRWRAA